MNKKGFTLIELLSVIVVLALILVIAIPRILNVIEGAEKETFRISGESLVREAREKYILESTNDEEFKTYIIEENEFMGESLPVSGKLPNNGVIEVDEDGNVYLEIRNEKYCAIKDFDSQNVLVTRDVENCRIELPLTNDCFETADVSATEIEITGYNYSCPLDVIIPSKISGKTVVAIGGYAFSEMPGNVYLTPNTLLSYNNSSNDNIEKRDSIYIATVIVDTRPKIKSVIIPNTVKYIGEYAFSSNQLTSITLPNSVTSIGEGAFGNNQLTSIIIPSSVTSIGPGAFSENKLTNVTIPNSVTSIGEYAFYDNQLTSITIPSSVTYIGSYAFTYNHLTTITIPSSVTSIGDSAFSVNQLTSIIIPSSVTSIGAGAFSNNHLTTITIPSSVTSIGNGAFNDNQLPDNLAFIYARKSDGSEDKTKIVSYGGAKRENIIIPSSVTDIGGGAFNNNQLTSITLPSSVTSIGKFAFAYNPLTNVIIPNSVTSIGDYAFYSNHLTSITIPNSVTSIGEYAFRNNQLTSITIPNSVTSIGKYAFAYNKLTNVVIPSSVTSIDEHAFYNNQLTSINIPSSVTSIDKYAFYDNQLTSITIPSSIPIDKWAVYPTFYTSYVTNNNKAGGTYTAPSQNGVWTKQ